MKAKILFPLMIALVLGLFPVQTRLYHAGLCIGDEVSCYRNMDQLDAYAYMISMQPWRDELWLQGGMQAVALEEWNAAEVFLTTAEEKGVLDQQGEQMLAETHLKLGNTDAGVEYMMALMAEGQLPVEDYRGLYDLLMVDFRVVEAEAVAQAWVSEEPRNVDAQLSLGLVQLTSDHFVGLKNLELAAVLDDSLHAFVRDLDLVIVQAHLSDDAAYQQLIIGRELANQGYPIYAEILCAQAVKINPQYAEAWAMLSEMQQQNGRSDGFDALETALQLNPNSALVQSLMALYWQRQGDPQQAVSYYEQLAALQPEEYRWQVELAKATADTGDIPSGYDLMLEVRNDFPDEVQVWIETANFCATYGMDISTVGLEAAREALAQDDENVSALSAMGNVFFALSDFDSAQRYYQRALTQLPQSAQLHYLLGRVYLEKENTSLAVYHLELALSLAPSYSTLTEQIELTIEAIQP